MTIYLLVNRVNFIICVYDSYRSGALAFSLVDCGISCDGDVVLSAVM